MTTTPIKNKGGRPKKDFVTFEEAREWASRLKLRNYKEWIKYARRRIPRGKNKGLKYKPRVIPANPQTYYKNEWISDTHFLGHTPYLDYQTAKQFVLSLKLNSMKQWFDWHKSTKPDFIPRFPYLHYKEWETWGIFLGSGNINPQQKKAKFRPYQEALKVVHQFNFNTAAEYRDWCRSNGKGDLPIVPEGVYKDVWEGWPKYLGKTITAKVECMNIDVSVIAIAQHSDFPNNVYEIRIDKGGKSSILEKQRTQHFKIVKIYQNDSTIQGIIQRAISINSSPWWDGNNMFLVQNIHQLLFDLDTILLWA
jgi:hypothetical protein